MSEREVYDVMLQAGYSLPTLQTFRKRAAREIENAVNRPECFMRMFGASDAETSDLLAEMLRREKVESTARKSMEDNAVLCWQPERV